MNCLYDASLPDNYLQDIYHRWRGDLAKTSWFTTGAISAAKCKQLGMQLLKALKESIELGEMTSNLATILDNISHIGVAANFKPSETALFVLSVRPYLEQLANLPSNTAAQMLEKAALYTFESYVRIREEIISQQRRDLLELSTPVIKLWDGILAVPIVGNVDSHRTQKTTEALLQAIADTGAKVAIIDITGVAMVDTLVANNIIKTASAARLLGASIIITGISPAIAQTIVQLGIDLSAVITRSVMADGVTLAFDMLNRKVVSK